MHISSITAGLQMSQPAAREELRTIPGKTEFLQLLVTQLRYQDPMSPMEDREFISQLATFTMLEELQHMNRAGAFVLLDREVTYRNTANDMIESGVVTSVVVRDQGYDLVVNGRLINADQVIEVHGGGERTWTT